MACRKQAEICCQSATKNRGWSRDSYAVQLLERLTGHHWVNLPGLHTSQQHLALRYQAV